MTRDAIPWTPDPAQIQQQQQQQQQQQAYQGWYQQPYAPHVPYGGTGHFVPVPQGQGAPMSFSQQAHQMPHYGQQVPAQTAAAPSGKVRPEFAGSVLERRAAERVCLVNLLGP